MEALSHEIGGVDTDTELAGHRNVSITFNAKLKSNGINWTETGTREDQGHSIGTLEKVKKKFSTKIADAVIQTRCTQENNHFACRSATTRPIVEI